MNKPKWILVAALLIQGFIIYCAISLMLCPEIIGEFFGKIVAGYNSVSK